MANVVITKKENTENNASPKHNPLFRTTNYIIMAAGLIVLLIGYFCLRGGAVEDPNTFDGEIFNAQRLVVAPVLIFIGLVAEIVAIMWRPKAKKQDKNTPEE